MFYGKLYIVQVDFCRCRHKDGRCPYSSDAAADGSGNHCIHAHSAAELDEWRERYRWRQSRKMAAKQQHLYSYMASLIDEYHNDDSTVSQLHCLRCTLAYHDITIFYHATLS